jgi:NhaP-type Na+/H+ or K+/H+ antiporter
MFEWLMIEGAVEHTRRARRGNPRSGCMLMCFVMLVAMAAIGVMVVWLINLGS